MRTLVKVIVQQYLAKLSLESFCDTDVHTSYDHHSKAVLCECTYSCISGVFNSHQPFT